MNPPSMIDINERLSERDWQILVTVRAFKYLTTRQLSRQHFSLDNPQGAIPRIANHSLARLRGLGLLSNLDRRIGGVRAGSGGHVWQITDLAYRLLCHHFHEPTSKRVRAMEPSTTFLDHTLAIAEGVLTLQEATRDGSVKLTRIQLEPTCWRDYLGNGGETRWLKPDLNAVTKSGDFEDHWFLEVDRATEPPGRIIRKCIEYIDYRRTGKEQSAEGLFPAVVWIVPNENRRDQLLRRIASETLIDQRLFEVITLYELRSLVLLGHSEFKSQNRTPLAEKSS
jgi:hypothetical protein